MSDPAIIIESKIQRKGGTLVDLDGTTYHFTPDAKGRHVAVVSNPEHIAKFLQIPEGYRMLVAAPATPVAAAQITQGVVSDQVLGPVDAQVVTVPGSLAIIKPAPAIQPTVDAPADQDPGQTTTTSDLDAMSLAEVREVFKVELGRNPSPKSIKETLVAQIEAVRAERAKA